MNSPVIAPYLSFIKIDRSLRQKIYIQISLQLVNAIQRGFLPAGTKLPGTRILSALLKVHRNTVISAYEELQAEGWIESQPNKGTFVLEMTALKAKKNSFWTTRSLLEYPQKTGYYFKKSNILDNPYEQSMSDYHFNDGIPDLRLTQIEDLSRLYSSNLKRKSNQKKLQYYNPEGSEYFKKQLSNYLNLSRGLHISTENLLITRSTEMSIYIASEILLSEGDWVIVGNPSYFSTNMIFQKSGAKICTVPIDRHGIDVESVRKLCENRKIRMLYITPHHHYPTTVTLCAQRRIKLLELASEFGFIIMEDDFDYDFHYDQCSVLPLASSDTEGMVIYIGSFGKSLAPGFRTGFMVAPENLMKEMQKYLGIIDRQGDFLMEQVLGEMIEEGDIHRSLKKSLKIYRERRDIFAELLNTKFGQQIQFEKPRGGLGFWIEWNEKINLMQLSRTCLQQKLLLPKTLLYQNKKLTAIRLGFGSLTPDEMEISLSILAKSALSLQPK